MIAIARREDGIFGVEIEIETGDEAVENVSRAMTGCFESRRLPCCTWRPLEPDVSQTLRGEPGRGGAASRCRDAIGEVRTRPGEKGPKGVWCRVVFWRPVRNVKRSRCREEAKILEVSVEQANAYSPKSGTVGGEDRYAGLRVQMQMGQDVGAWGRSVAVGQGGLRVRLLAKYLGTDGRRGVRRAGHSLGWASVAGVVVVVDTRCGRDEEEKKRKKK